MNRDAASALEFLAALTSISDHGLAQRLCGNDRALSDRLSDVLFRSWPTFSEEEQWLAADRAGRFVDSPRILEIAGALSRRHAPHSEHLLARLGSSLAPALAEESPGGPGNGTVAPDSSVPTVDVRGLVNLSAGHRFLNATAARAAGMACELLHPSEGDLAHSYLDGLALAVCARKDRVEALIKDCPWVLQCETASAAVVRATGRSYLDRLAPEQAPFLLISTDMAGEDWPLLTGRALEVAVEHIFESRYVASLRGRDAAQRPLDRTRLRALQSAFAIREATKIFPSRSIEPLWRQSLAHVRSRRVGELCGFALKTLSPIRPFGTSTFHLTECTFATDERMQAYRVVATAADLEGCWQFSLAIGDDLTEWEVTSSAPDINSVMAYPIGS